MIVLHIPRMGGGEKLWDHFSISCGGHLAAPAVGVDLSRGGPVSCLIEARGGPAVGFVEVLP